MNERRSFIEALDGDDSMATLCRRFGISRKTGYKWLQRYARDGDAGLRDLRGECLRPGRYPDGVIEEILQLRGLRPRWGAPKLLAHLGEKHPGCSWPSQSMVKELLREAGFVRRRVRRSPCPVEPVRPQLRPMAACDDVWCLDFKGWFRTGDRKVCEPLTVLDGFSRYLLLCEIAPGRKWTDIWEMIDGLFEVYGQPLAVRTDNGPPFGSHGLGGLSPLSVKLIKRGIMPDKIRPGHPEENGRQERLHRTLKEETAAPAAPTLEEQKARLEMFRNDYNSVRPHAALGQTPPGRHYVPSKRKARSGYDYPEGTQTQPVNSKGYVTWRGHEFYLSESLSNETIGIGREQEAGYYLEFLGFPLGYLKEEALKRENIKKSDG